MTILPAQAAGVIIQNRWLLGVFTHIRSSTYT